VKRASAGISIFFILILLFMNARFVLFTSYVKSQKQEFRKQALAQNLSELIQIETEAGELYKNKRGFEWEKNNKELVISGVYHEVLNVVLSNGKALITIIPDKAENELFAYFFKNKTPGNRSLYLYAFVFGIVFDVPSDDRVFSCKAAAISAIPFIIEKLTAPYPPSLIKPPSERSLITYC
jgi:hypothetical protein